MTTRQVDAETGQPAEGQREVLLKGLPSRPAQGAWSAAERDWLDGQCRIASAMRRELTIAAGAYHTLCALQWPSARIVEDVAARLPQFQHIVSVIDPAQRAAHPQAAQDARLSTCVTHPLAWLLKQPREGRMFLLLDPDALFTPSISPRRLLQTKSHQGACAFALVSPGQGPSAMATALSDEGHKLCWQQSVQSQARDWHLSLWRTQGISMVIEPTA